MDARTGRTPHGVRGLKLRACRRDGTPVAGRTPHGVRGLKRAVVREAAWYNESHPSRGAWIETVWQCRQCDIRRVAPLTGCVD